MKEEKTIIEKIQKTSNTGVIVTTIVKIFCIAMSVITILAGIIMVGVSDWFNRVFEELIATGELQMNDLDFLEGTLMRNLFEQGDFATTIGAEIIAMGAMLLCTAVLIHFVGKVFKEMRESYSPFQISVIKNLKVVFVLATLLIVSSSLGIGIIVAIAFWCVIHIFEYGCELQKQSDETL